LFDRARTLELTPSTGAATNHRPGGLCSAQNLVLAFLQLGIVIMDTGFPRSQRPRKEQTSYVERYAQYCAVLRVRLPNPSPAGSIEIKQGKRWRIS
jgi:hypothetical protein